MTNPAAGTGPKAFSVPSDSSVTLQANTTYTVVIQSDTTLLNYNGFTLRNTESTAEDSGGAAGWQIADDRLSNSGNGWSATGGNLTLRMAVLGTGGSVSDDATLSSLTLAGGTGTAVALDPAFATGTTSYTASVAYSVNTVTVTAAATHANATVSVSDDDDTTTPGTAEPAQGTKRVTTLAPAPVRMLVPGPGRRNPRTLASQSEASPALHCPPPGTFAKQSRHEIHHA